MREPDAWWGHIPVVIEALWKVREHEERYRRMLRSALANIELPTDLQLIPDEGFLVQIVAGMEKPSEVLCGFMLVENLEGYSKASSLARMNVVGKVIYHSPADLGTDANPFVPLFSEFDASIASGWADYLAWRRPKRWKPVPGWLLKIRTEEREAKRSKKPVRVAEKPGQSS